MGWDIGIALYLILVFAMAAGATPESMHQRAALEDQARWVFLMLMAGAAFWLILYRISRRIAERPPFLIGKVGWSPQSSP